MKFVTAIFMILFSSIAAWAGGDVLIIKTNGAYGIINKGENQGIKEGLLFDVKRESGNGLVDVCQVKVIRATPNRAAVEQVNGREPVILRKGDALYSESEQPAALIEPARETPARIESDVSADNSRIRPIENNTKHETPPAPEPVDERPLIIDRDDSEKEPWITLNTGTSIPNTSFDATYNPGLVIGGSYMVPAGKGFNLGIEINNNLLGGSPVVIDPSGLSTTSTSLLEAHAVMQKFFGRAFFLELGGGLYRPKIRTISIDNFESIYSSTNFGFFGGAGVFMHTSPYAGVVFKGRLHSYFDRQTRQYYGLTGGFRFKIR